MLIHNYSFYAERDNQLKNRVRSSIDIIDNHLKAIDFIFLSRVYYFSVILIILIEISRISNKKQEVGSSILQLTSRRLICIIIKL